MKILNINSYPSSFLESFVDIIIYEEFNGYPFVITDKGIRLCFCNINLYNKTLE